jgi:hypothetical protein
MADSTRYSDMLHLRLSPSLNAAIDQAARARGTRPSEWCRQALQTGLALDGVTLAPVAPRDAGAMYDVTADGQRYARIDGDQIVHMSYSASKPDDGQTWVPVVHEDSEPFDSALHWRLAPHYAIVDQYGTPNRVICTYPVVLKSMEHA